MRTETLTRRDDLLIRRLVLEPGEAMPWHTDPCRRFSVVIRGARLRIEFRETAEPVTLELHPGLAGWGEPDVRVHRAVNAGDGTYEEIGVFFLPAPGADPQPTWVPTRHCPVIRRARRMHGDEIGADPDLARRLVESQFPQWSSLPIEPVVSGGTENAIYRLGDDMVLRLPLRPGAGEQVEKLLRWLPEIAPRLPLQVPLPIARGEPCAQYPSVWSIYRWLEGSPAAAAGIPDPARAAHTLGEFLAARTTWTPTPRWSITPGACSRL